MNLLYAILLIAIIVILFKVKVIFGIIALLVVAAGGIYAFIPNMYTTKGNLAYRDKKYEEAAKWYKKAVDTKRVPIRTRVSYTRILLRIGKADEAEEVLNTILRHTKLKPADRNLAKQQRCMVYYKQGRMDEAYNEGMDLFNDGYKNILMYGMIGYFKLLRNDPIDETLAFCEEAYEYDNEDRDILDNLSICYYRKGEYEKADEISRKVIESNPSFIEAYYHAAQIAVKCGNFEYAKECMDKIPECTRSEMTTISEEEIKKLSDEIDAKLN